MRLSAVKKPKNIAILGILLFACIGIAASVNGLFIVAGEKPPVEIKAPAQPASEPHLCPPTWEDSSTRDEHATVLSCSKGKWVVILRPDHTFNYAFQIDTPGAAFVFNPSEVPGWR